MRIALRVLLYLVAAASFVSGAYVLAVEVGIRAGEERAKIEPARPQPPMYDSVLRAVEGASPAGLALGLGGVVLGLLLARPFATIRVGARGDDRKRTLQDIVNDAFHQDQNVRLEAVSALSKLCKPQTIPALIRALRDNVTRVRGQACEGLENMTGMTFDFMDVAPKSARDKAVLRWTEWWKRNERAILSGADPRSLAEEGAASSGEEQDFDAMVAAAAERASGRPSSRVGPAIPTPSPEPRPPAAPAPVPSPPGEDVPAVPDSPGDAPPSGGVGAPGAPPTPGGVGRVTPVPGSISLGEYVRKKRERESSRVGKPVPKPPGPAGPKGKDDDIRFEPGDV